jgi:thiol-disulfide isomerase/thioredoxin
MKTISNHADLDRARGRRGRAVARAAAALALALAVSPPADAQDVPADAVLRDFEPTGDYVLESGGQSQPAEIFFSDRVPAYLILSSQVPSPTLLLPRSGSVETVSIMKLARRGDGSVDILADAELAPAGRFTIGAGGEEISFALSDRRFALVPKPYLLGLQDSQAMLDYSADYQRSAAAYRPDSAVVAGLRAQAKLVRVRVYFGSWCPFCKRYLPYMVKVAETLAGSRIQFEFYGLPKPFDGEPQAEADKVRGVPTGVVWVDGREAGRIEGGAWQTPEASLAMILNGGGAGGAGGAGG